MSIDIWVQAATPIYRRSIQRISLRSPVDLCMRSTIYAIITESESSIFYVFDHIWFNHIHE